VVLWFYGWVFLAKLNRVAVCIGSYIYIYVCMYVCMYVGI
jgi:hypothetical protein